MLEHCMNYLTGIVLLSKYPVFLSVTSPLCATFFFFFVVSMIKGKYHVKVNVGQEMRVEVFHVIQREVAQCPTRVHIPLTRDCGYFRVK